MTKEAIVFVALVVVGALLMYLGYSFYDEVTRESTLKPRSISMTALYDTKLGEMSIFISDTAGRVDFTEGWRAAMVEFDSSSPKVNFVIRVPYEIAHFSSANYTNVLNAEIAGIYDKAADESTIRVSYTAEGNHSRIRLMFDWKIAEKFSYDQERLVLGFGTPFIGAEIGERREIVADARVLHVDRLVVEIDEKKQLDYSRTVPPPTFLKTMERSVNPVWSFGQYGPTSAIQAVFTDESLRQRKSVHTFLSGVLVALGLSILLEPFLEILRKLAHW